MKKFQMKNTKSSEKYRKKLKKKLQSKKNLQQLVSTVNQKKSSQSAAHHLSPQALKLKVVLESDTQYCTPRHSIFLFDFSSCFDVWRWFCRNDIIALRLLWCCRHIILELICLCVFFFLIFLSLVLLLPLLFLLLHHLWCCFLNFIHVIAIFIPCALLPLPLWVQPLSVCVNESYKSVPECKCVCVFHTWKPCYHPPLSRISHLKIMS